ncbi:MAG: CpaF family protein [Candidatus Omnitrophica bacterium]|jgi:pilus assembly protein CpaF|nr:CpaF family protein [Candidatus Omnitrophota bacterium]
MSREIKEKIKNKIISQYSGLLLNNADKQLMRQKVADAVDILITEDFPKLEDEVKAKLKEELTDELTGLGPIEKLMLDPQVTEVMINGPRKVYAEIGGKTKLTNVAFDNEAHLMYFLNKMLLPTRRRVDESLPYTEIALDSGARVNIVIAPLALNGPVVTIRKFLKEIKTIEDLVNLGTMDNRMSQFLKASIQAQANVIFSGPTGVGKTTTLNVLSSYISEKERIITIEDTAELRLTQDHVVRLESRNPNMDGKGEITIRELFKNSLRMRPDRIILGEIRGAEALEMLQAICSGHRGSLSVLHASSPQDVIYRLETMILTSGISISLEAIQRQMSASLDLIVQQEQLLDGSRKITHITQANGTKDGQVCLEDIFIYDLEGITADGKVKGKWKATGVVPKFYPQLVKKGIALDQGIFNKG